VVAYVGEAGLPVLGGRFLVPYALPASGEAVAIGTNHANDLTPVEDNWTTTQWNYSLFGSFGAGTFVSGYSLVGAYVLAGTGGHDHPDNPGGVVFDFSTATWIRLDNQNGVGRRTEGNLAFSLADYSNGAPWHEFTGTEVPLPPHPYATLCEYKHGPKGGVIYVTRSAIGSESGTSTGAHVFDLHTRLWSRIGTSTADSSRFESDGVFDEARNRYWRVIPQQHEHKSVSFFDLDGLTWELTAAQSTWPPSALGGDGRVMFHDGMLLRRGQGGLYLYDPGDPVTGWVALTVSGSFPAARNRWARYSNGNYYSIDRTGGNTITRIAPPANPKTGTWVIDTVSIGGATLPETSREQQHYNRLINVPRINCLAWIPGGSNSVFLLKPAT